MEHTQFVSGYAPVFKGQLYYEVAGSGNTVLFIHAGVADCNMWNEQFNFFSQFYRVIRYDARGFGKSRTETTEFSNRQDILDLFNHLQVDKACIIGISRGGQIAIDFTLEYPERVVALIAVAPGISGFEYQPEESDESRHEFELFTRMDELWENKAFDELADLQVHVWADGPSQPVGRASAEVRDYMRKTIRANLTRQDGVATPLPLNPLATSRLGEIKVPALVLIGEYDTSNALAIADKIEREVPNARKVDFPGAAHMIPMEQGSRFNEIVLSFLHREM